MTQRLYMAYDTKTGDVNTVTYRAQVNLSNSPNLYEHDP